MRGDGANQISIADMAVELRLLANREAARRTARGYFAGNSSDPVLLRAFEQADRQADGCAAAHSLLKRLAPFERELLDFLDDMEKRPFKTA
jgi:hypothetical protein